jgi:hypothetical protein
MVNPGEELVTVTCFQTLKKLPSGRLPRSAFKIPKKESLLDTVNDFSSISPENYKGDGSGSGDRTHPANAKRS